MSNTSLLTCVAVAILHWMAASPVLAAAGPEARRAFRCSILSYELFYTSLNFTPQHYVILKEEDLEDKTRMCQEYKSQIAKGKGYTEKEFIYGWAKTRGGQIDKDYAEAFECIRFVS